MTARLFSSIPNEFWGLFKSPNMDIYIEALLKINEEYMYNDYFLSKESCLNIIKDFCDRNTYDLSYEDMGNDNISNEQPASIILNKLLNKFRWLNRNEDYINNVTNIVIPDYSAVFIEAFEKILKPELNSSDIYSKHLFKYLFCSL